MIYIREMENSEEQVNNRILDETDDDGAASGGEHSEGSVHAEREQQDVAAGAERASNASRRKRHRRGKSKKRKWKPYNKLTWEEKRELEDRESRRAHRVREERFATGQPVAPYNTTQFLMEDHQVQEPDLIRSTVRPHRESTGTIESDEYYYSSPEDEEEFLQKEFSEVYDNIHAERLGAMSKHELIQEYLQMEDRVDKLEHKLKKNAKMVDDVVENNRLNNSETQNAEQWDDNAENLEKIRIFQQEIRKLAEENGKLRRENELLRTARKNNNNQQQSNSLVTTTACIPNV